MHPQLYIEYFFKTSFPSREILHKVTEIKDFPFTNLRENCIQNINKLEKLIRLFLFNFTFRYIKVCTTKMKIIICHYTQRSTKSKSLLAVNRSLSELNQHS